MFNSQLGEHGLETSPDDIVSYNRQAELPRASFSLFTAEFTQTPHRVLPSSVSPPVLGSFYAIVIAFRPGLPPPSITNNECEDLELVARPELSGECRGYSGEAAAASAGAGLLDTAENSSRIGVSSWSRGGGRSQSGTDSRELGREDLRDPSSAKDTSFRHFQRRRPQLPWTIFVHQDPTPSPIQSENNTKSELRVRFRSGEINTVLGCAALLN